MKGRRGRGGGEEERGRQKSSSRRSLVVVVAPPPPPPPISLGAQSQRGRGRREEGDPFPPGEILGELAGALEHI